MELRNVGDLVIIYHCSSYLEIILVKKFHNLCIFLICFFFIYVFLLIYVLLTYKNVFHIVKM